ncbi:hypothetical protein Y1Q_0003263 [Alligator mississippiensis]|uniref:Uncharacterized protein n=1 Tax=Alligator mississippiensis TaxID=8496 RepID=A0A151ME20_ALLMI|nr:hypothetical protein Y1Q_0003263 [Alligator mississippiensis]
MQPNWIRTGGLEWTISQPPHFVQTIALRVLNRTCKASFSQRTFAQFCGLNNCSVSRYSSSCDLCVLLLSSPSSFAAGGMLCPG